MRTFDEAKQVQEFLINNYSKESWWIDSSIIKSYIEGYFISLRAKSNCTISPFRRNGVFVFVKANSK